MKKQPGEQQITAIYTRSNLASQFFSNFIDNSQIDSLSSQISDKPSFRINQSIDEIKIKAFQMKNLLLIWQTVSKRQYIDRWIQNKQYVKYLEKRTPQFMTKVFLKIFYTIALKLQLKYSWSLKKIQKYAQNKPVAKQYVLTETKSIKIKAIQQIYQRKIQQQNNSSIIHQAFIKIYNFYKFKSKIIKFTNSIEQHLKISISEGWLKINNFVSFQNKIQILAGTINLTIHPCMRQAFWCIKKQIPTYNKAQDSEILLTMHINSQHFSFHKTKVLKEPMIKSYSPKTILQDRNIVIFKEQAYRLLDEKKPIRIDKPLRNQQIKTQINDFGDIFNFQQITQALLGLDFPRRKPNNLISLAKLKRKKEEHSKTLGSLNSSKIFSPLKGAQSTQTDRKVDNQIYHKSLSYQKQQITKQRKIVINYNKIGQQKSKKRDNQSQYFNFYVDKTNLFTERYAEKVKKNTHSFRNKVQSINHKDQNQRNQLKKCKSNTILTKSSQKIHQPNQYQHEYRTVKQSKNKKQTKKLSTQLKGQYFHCTNNKNKKQQPFK